MVPWENTARDLVPWDNTRRDLCPGIIQCGLCSLGIYIYIYIKIVRDLCPTVWDLASWDHAVRGLCPDIAPGVQHCR